jgi:hypothetical protein
MLDTGTDSLGTSFCQLVVSSFGAATDLTSANANVAALFPTGISPGLPRHLLVTDAGSGTKQVQYTDLFGTSHTVTVAQGMYLPGARTIGTATTVGQLLVLF